MFDVGVLLYGADPEPAERCLHSLQQRWRGAAVASIRLWVNAASAAGGRVLDAAWKFASECKPAWVGHTDANIGKYPVMRRLLYGDEARYGPSRAAAPSWMWFDDDSYLTVPVKDAAKWWSQAANRVRGWRIIGQRFRISFKPSQLRGIQAAPWYNDKPFPAGYKVQFASGGWHACPRDFLTTWGYPFLELDHNGGDSLLGELCRQQELPIDDYHKGVAINTSVRRGRVSPWPWDGKWTGPPDHDFAAAWSPW